MPRPNRLREIADGKGVTVEQMIGGAIEETGTIFRAALEIGVTPSAINNWMHANGYGVKTTSKLVRLERANRSKDGKR